MSLEDDIRLACLQECSAPKPGNVHPAAAFDDLTYDDFQRSAPITAQWLSQSRELGVGRAVLSAATELSAVVGKNTHLGILLLLAPLAAIDRREEMRGLLESLSVGDAVNVYDAIAALQPGGMGEVSVQDVREVPTVTLLECMKLAADRDTIAQQYANGFADVFRFADHGAELIAAETLDHGIVQLHLHILSQIPDSLIARKCGRAIAQEASSRASDVVAGDCEPAAILNFDAWLRADGHRRNPGTTADMVAAVLFILRREGLRRAL